MAEFAANENARSRLCRVSIGLIQGAKRHLSRSSRSTGALSSGSEGKVLPVRLPSLFRGLFSRMLDDAEKRCQS